MGGRGSVREEITAAIHSLRNAVGRNLSHDAKICPRITRLRSAPARRALIHANRQEHFHKQSDSRRLANRRSLDFYIRVHLRHSRAKHFRLRLRRSGTTNQPQNRVHSAAQKNPKKFKKKLATVLALQLDGKLARLTGLPSVQKKFKKKLVRVQKV
ncbi:MAG: hypothetical protein DME76_05360 [Verrucomicrobia bacterium]|nr:MAG: hypothetical protein DME76_05360 [Verrucomicrobiota bacterium]